MVGAPLEGEGAKCAGGVLGAPFVFQGLQSTTDLQQIKAFDLHLPTITSQIVTCARDWRVGS